MVHQNQQFPTVPFGSETELMSLQQKYDLLWTNNTIVARRGYINIPENSVFTFKRICDAWAQFVHQF